MEKIILEERGCFWWHAEIIPDGQYAPSSAVPGVLRIHENGYIELDLDSSLSNSPSEEFSMEEKYIQGFFTKKINTYVLLLSIHLNETSFMSPGIRTESYSAIQCLVGEGYFPNNRDLLEFTHLKVDLAGYEDWLRLGSIRVNRTQTKFSAKYKKPDDLTYQFEDEKLIIKYDAFGPSLIEREISKLSFRESVSLIYTPNKVASLNYMHAQYILLRDFFILLTDSNYHFTWPLVYNEKRKYKFYFPHMVNSVNSIDKYESCTNLVILKEELGDLFCAWRKKRENYGPGFYLYLSTKRDMNLYEENLLTTLLWGIESFHRSKYPDAVPSEKLRNKITRILSVISDAKDKKWLKGKLKNATEPPLEKRIFELFKNLPINLDSKKLRDFCSECADIRNDISHFGIYRKRKGKEYKGYDEWLENLRKKTNALSYLYHTLLLQEIGIKNEILTSKILQGRRLRKMQFAFINAGLLEKED